MKYIELNRDINQTTRCQFRYRNQIGNDYGNDNENGQFGQQIYFRD